MLKKILFAVVAVLAMTLAQTAQGQSYGFNFVVLRVNDTTVGSGNTSSVSLLTYTSSRTAQSSPLQTINVVSSGTDAATISGTSSTEGVLQRSQNGQYLVFGGYRADAGSSRSGVDRVVVRVNNLGTVDTSTSVTASTSFSGDNSIRSVATVDGSSYYLGGEGNNTSRGVVYVGSHGTSSQSGVAIVNGNLRSVGIFDSQLYISSGAATGAAANFARGVARTNTALPTTTQADSAVTKLIDQASGASHHFILLDRSTSVAGLDTLYVADLGSNQIDKYSFDGSVWTGRSSFSASGVNGIIGLADDGSGRAVLYYTSATGIRSVIDQAAFDADFSGLDDILIASAGTNQAFRGIAFAPIPEPGTILGASALGLAGLALVRRRMKRQLA